MTVLLTSLRIEKQRIDTDGILDMKWKGNVLTCAMSSGHLERYQFTDQAQLSSRIEIDSSAIALNLDVCPVLDRSIVSLNNGCVALVVEDQVETWQAHLCEAWCASFDRHDLNTAYSGSDDYTFKVWDIRMPTSPTSTCKYHSAGVCSVVSDPHREWVLASGSYDESCAIWDRRNLRQPTSTLQAASGVWRLRWHPTRPGRLLAACMHDGFKVWDTQTQETLGACPTDSIAYGSDWIFAKDREAYGGAIFYTHKAIIWSI